MCFSSKVERRPSQIIRSTSVPSPIRYPERAFGSAYGAFDIDSMPPVTTTSTSPARIIESAISTARMDDAQTLFTASAGTSSGSPAAIAACRAGAWPAPAWSTWPMITYSTSLPSSPMRSSAARMAIEPRSVAEWFFSPPARRPNGVRTVETMTVRLTPLNLLGGLDRAVMQDETAVVVVDRDDVELAQHVGAEQPLHTAARVAEREVRLDDGRRGKLHAADAPGLHLDRRNPRDRRDACDALLRPGRPDAQLLCDLGVDERCRGAGVEREGVRPMPVDLDRHDGKHLLALLQHLDRHEERALRDFGGLRLRRSATARGQKSGERDRGERHLHARATGQRAKEIPASSREANATSSFTTASTSARSTTSTGECMYRSGNETRPVAMPARLR